MPFLQNVQKIMLSLDTALKETYIRPVVYDQVEVFSKVSDHQVYPFKPRKSNMPLMRMFNKLEYGSKGSVQYLESTLQLSYVCYDKYIYQEFMFWEDEKCDIERSQDSEFQYLKLEDYFSFE